MTELVEVEKSTLIQYRTGSKRALYRLVHNPLGLSSAIVVVIIILIASLAAVISPYGPGDANFGALTQRPGTAGYLLGTDNLGRDMLTRTFWGMQASLLVGVISVLVAIAIGVPLGLLSGSNRYIDAVVSRLSDVTLAFPALIVALGLAAINGANLTNAAIAIGISYIPVITRVVRVETLRISALDFVTSAKVQGAGQHRILSRYVLPNALSPLIVQVTMIIPTAILMEAGLSFLGLGLQPPMPSLGVMLAEAQQYFTVAPWAAVVPGLAILLMCLSFNILGDALRDALDVY
ncbi:ABC transporter permease [Cryobacterium sp. Y82]|uniref:ABC transporter permease n=1 Tax=Cryobacterium sp. Y82 TaxID=2045017 RepID=UPI001E469DB9|nr:ABC transporter permease [Cryobacterium sp. Y82]